MTMLTIITKYLLDATPSSHVTPRHNISNIICSPVVAYLLRTSYLFLDFTNNESSCTIPLVRDLTILA